MIDISDVRLEENDRSEVLRYLGYTGQKLEENMEEAISDAIQSLNEAATPKLIYKFYDLPSEVPENPEEVVFPEELKFLEGEDIRKHLAGCHQVVLLSATIGLPVDQLIKQAAIRDSLKSVLMDSAGSTLVEAVCDTAEARLRQEVEDTGNYLTSRFSPGYGDLPLHAQGPFFEALEIRRIGISLSSDDLMTPRKSVTAVLGVSHHPVKKLERTCNDCNLNQNCRFRRLGLFCGE